MFPQNENPKKRRQLNALLRLIERQKKLQICLNGCAAKRNEFLRKLYEAQLAANKIEISRLICKIGDYEIFQQYKGYMHDAV